MMQRHARLLIALLAALLLLGYALANDGEAGGLHAQSVGQPYAPMVQGTFIIRDGNDTAPVPAGLKLSFLNGHGLHNITTCATTTTTAGGNFTVTIPATPNCGGSTTYFVAAFDGMNVGGAYVTPQNVSTPAIAGLQMPAIVALRPVDSLLVTARYFGVYSIAAGAQPGPAGQIIGLYPGALTQQAGTCASAGLPARCVDPNALALATVCGSTTTVDGGNYVLDLQSDDPACVGTGNGAYLTLLFVRADTGEIIGTATPPVSFDLELLGIPGMNSLISYEGSPSSTALTGGVTATATATGSNPPQSGGVGTGPGPGDNPPGGGPGSGPGNTPPGGGPGSGPGNNPPSNTPTPGPQQPPAPALNPIRQHVVVQSDDMNFVNRVSHCFDLYESTPGGLQDLIQFINAPDLPFTVYIRPVDATIKNEITYDTSMFDYANVPMYPPPYDYQQATSGFMIPTYDPSSQTTVWQNGPGASALIYIDPSAPSGPDTPADIPTPNAPDPFTVFSAPPDDTGLCVHLIHELGHAYDIMHGADDWTVIPNDGPLQPGCDDTGGIKQSEINASTWENWYRYYHAPTLRATYCYPLPPEAITPWLFN